MNTSSQHVSTIVVGSGFGGSVVAYRLAAAGDDVTLLERGKPYPPGSFPRTPTSMARNYWDPSRGFHGLYDVWSFRGIEAVVSSGLGGGSLIYANVLLRKDEKWFVQDAPVDGDGYEQWPISRRQLEPHYDAVETMLGAQRFPMNAPGYEHVRKTHALRLASERLGLAWQLPPLAITFGQGDSPPRPGEKIPEPVYGNLHGAPRSTCRLTGECYVGCNSGSKNTLDHTYLSAAEHAGADIRTRHEVRSFAPRDGGGWVVRYVRHESGNEGVPTNTRALRVHEMTCDRLVLAAGALGSTYLLLRNAQSLPALSPMVGHRFSGNGDLLGFVHSVRYDGRRSELGNSQGPVITSAVRMPDEADGGDRRGYYVEDAGVPGFVSWLIEVADAGQRTRRWVRFAKARVAARVLSSPRSDIGGEIARTIGEGRMSGASTPLLGMGRDVPDGVMTLRRGYLDVNWTTNASRKYFDDVRDTMAALAAAMDGRFLANPLSLLDRVATVHPLGGAPMGRDIRRGVVDEWGEVFGHPGLYVVDGAAMPGPIGANPSLTIAAFADRAAEHMLEESSGRSVGGAP